MFCRCSFSNPWHRFAIAKCVHAICSRGACECEIFFPPTNSLIAYELDRNCQSIRLIDRTDKKYKFMVTK